MIEQKTSVFRGLFSTNDPIDSLRDKQDRFVESMEHVKGSPSGPDFSVHKESTCDGDSQAREEQEV